MYVTPPRTPSKRQRTSSLHLKKISAGYGPFSISADGITVSTQTSVSETTLEKLTSSPSKITVRHMRVHFPYWQKKLKPLKGHITLNWSYGGQASAGTGLALINPSGFPNPSYNWNAVIIPRYFTRDWILGVSSDSADDYTILKNQTTNAAMDLFKANPNALVAAAASSDVDTYINTAPSGGAGQPTDGQLQINVPQQYMTIHSMDETIQIKSFTSVPQTVQIYWFICTEDTASHPLDEWYFAMSNRKYYQRSQSGGGGNVLSGYEDNPSQIPNLSLKGYKKIFDNWRIFHAESFVLQQSEEVKFLVKHKIGRTLKYENVADLYSPTYIKDLSMCPVVIANGGLVKLKVGENPATGCTTADTSLGSVVTRSMKISFPEHTAKYAYDVSQLRLAQNVPSGQVQEIDEDGGAQIPVVI